MKKSILLGIFVLLAACAHSVHQVHVSDMNTDKSIYSGRVVRSSAEQFTILGFVGDTDYVDNAYSKLLAQCKNGTIEGIVAQYSTSLGFFSWTNKIRLEGRCFS